ncbi:MAG: hypothetical protein M1834_004657 [Cirrosporium novae-zelandiae]|nr:MAG: hypothetical protein M1834_004657 [Cirrosporium novae-zelandiae]
MSTKRKATIAASPDSPASASKRRRFPEDEFPATETPEWVAQTAREFLEKDFKATKDKHGRSVVPDFLTLPDKSLLPQYYEAIRLPIAIDTIEAKLDKLEYPSMSAFESDLKRMISNAKSFNEKNSLIYADAERLRKTISNRMPYYNPAYKDPSYSAIPTPIPDRSKTEDGEGDVDGDDADAEGEEDLDAGKPVNGRSPSLPSHHVSLKLSANRYTAEGVSSEVTSAGTSFKGDSFQAAQEKIIDEMFYLRDASGRDVSQFFRNLPSKSIPGYYESIKYPMSIREMKKKVQGGSGVGRGRPSGITQLRTWQAFEHEISFIWKNAREFNEAGSEIVELVGKLEAYFQKRVSEAKKFVPDPPAEPTPRINLKMGNAKSPEPLKQKIKLWVGQKASPASTPKPSANPDIGVDQEALRRQQELVKAGTNGLATETSSSRPSSRNPFGGSQSTPTTMPVPAFRRPSHDSQQNESATSPTDAVKSEAVPNQDPNTTAAQQKRSESQSSQEGKGTSQPADTAVMPPPSTTTPRIPSSSPQPQSQPSNHNVRPTISPFETRFRLPGKDLSHALIRNVTIRSHPGLSLKRAFHLNIPAHPTLSQQSITITVPHTHYYIQIFLDIAPSLQNRQSKLFVSLTGPNMGVKRLNPSLHPASIPGGNNNGRAESQAPTQGQSVYENRIETGVNKLEIEAVAGPLRGVPRTGGDIEMERFTVFINLLKP